MKEAGRIMIFDPVVLLCDGGNRGFSGVVGVVLVTVHVVSSNVCAVYLRNMPTLCLGVS